MVKVLLVYGTRPEAIKMAPVVNELARRPDVFVPVQCVTAQHRQMLDQVMNNFDLMPEYDLNIMSDGQSPADVGSCVLAKLPPVLDSVKPDILLVQGDTMTTVSAALAAFLGKIPVGHIEAGLRTGDLNHPFPEEMNRRLTSQLATLHFPPTRGAADALLQEGVDQSSIHVTGNTVIDALVLTLEKKHDFEEPALAALDENSRVVLITTHRRENFGEPLLQICHAVAKLADLQPDVTFVWPVHKNPRVNSTVRDELANVSNVVLIDPLEYPAFVALMAKSTIILSDSGGVQEEAPSLDVPVLVLREATERPEGMAAGATKLVGTNSNRIVEATMELLTNQDEHRRMASAKNPFGDGSASSRIADSIATYFK